MNNKVCILLTIETMTNDLNRPLGYQSPLYGMLIGYGLSIQFDEGEKSVIKVVEDQTREKEAIDNLSTLLEKLQQQYSTMLITFQGKIFDLPFLITRGAILGSKIKPLLHYDLDKRNTINHFDWYMSLFNYFKRKSLPHNIWSVGEEIAGVFPYIDRSGLFKMYTDGLFQGIEQHLINKLTILIELHKKFGGEMFYNQFIGGNDVK